jgi:hypothetical protein
MKKIIGFIVLVSSLLLLAFQCDKGDDLVASCVQDKIAAFSMEACPTGATIKSYYFQSDFVYVFDYGPCGADMAMPVLNNSCDTLGFLGGFIGNTMINNQDFHSAEFVKTIWFN